MAARLDPSIKAEIIRLHERGTEPADIARQLNVNDATVHNTLKDHELELLREIVGPLLKPADIKKLDVHEWCSIYPAMSEEDLDALGESIEKDGLQVRIVVWNRKWIIDGRNRFFACRNRNIKLEPRHFLCVDCDEARAREIVDVLNLRRRHLTPKQQEILHSQAAMRAAEKLKSMPGTVRSNRPVVAKEEGVSAGSVWQAKQVSEKSPEIAEKVKKGEKTLQDARRELGLAKPKTGRSQPKDPTALERIKEEYEERAAIRDQDSDEAWVEGLDLYKKLSGKNRDAFVRDAMAYRHLKAARREWGAAVAGELKANRKTPAWLAKQERALAIGGPEHWEFCSSEDGGCDGEGAFPFGDGDRTCNNCYGHGYILR